jgi:hypothetical protein
VTGEEIALSLALATMTYTVVAEVQWIAPKLARLVTALESVSSHPG